MDIERCEIMEETINEKMRVLRENKQLRRNTDAQLTIWSDSFVDQAMQKRIDCQGSERKNFSGAPRWIFSGQFIFDGSIG